MSHLQPDDSNKVEPVFDALEINISRFVEQSAFFIVRHLKFVSLHSFDYYSHFTSYLITAIYPSLSHSDTHRCSHPQKAIHTNLHSDSYAKYRSCQKNPPLPALCKHSSQTCGFLLLLFISFHVLL